jgi:hypothetical protein
MDLDLFRNKGENGYVVRLVITHAHGIGLFGFLGGFDLIFFKDVHVLMFLEILTLPAIFLHFITDFY